MIPNNKFLNDFVTFIDGTRCFYFNSFYFGQKKASGTSGTKKGLKDNE
jgi:hypothetical protein